MQPKSFAVTVTNLDGQWQVRSFADDFTDPRTSIAAVRDLRTEGASFALLCVEDEYFVVARPAPGSTAVLISDVTMAVDDEFAEQFAREAGLDVPDIDPGELDEIDGWADGDFSLLSDLGLSEEILSVIADDDELWPSEAIDRIAEELGFAEELAEATGN